MDVNADEEEMDEEAATQSFPSQVWRSYRKARRSRRRNGLAQNPNRRIMSFVQTGVLALFTIQSSQRDTWKSITTPKNSRRRLPRLFSNAACG
jgi:deferrochelatase/peroxidase EfeB